MSSLPSQHPNLSLHLSDRNLHPILTSARTDTQLEALTSLATTSLTAHSAAQRLSLGHPQRLIVEHGPGNPVVLTSYLDPGAAAAAAAAAATASQTNTTSKDDTAAPNGPHPSSPSRSPPSSPSPADESPGPAKLEAALAATTISDPPFFPPHSSSPSTSKARKPHRNSASAPHTRSPSVAAPMTPQKGKGKGPAAKPPGTRTGTATPTARNGASTPVASAAAAAPTSKPNPPSTAPMLLGVVVAGTADEALEARRAAARLERVGRDVQREWDGDGEGDDDDDGGHHPSGDARDAGAQYYYKGEESDDDDATERKRYESDDSR